jgi:hypothetical protein
MRQTALFMRGSLNWDHNAFIVNIQPHLRGGNVKRRQLNSTTHWCDQLAMVDFGTCLDPRTTCLISIVNIGGAPGAAFALRHVDLMKPSLSMPSSTASPSTPKNHKRSAGEITGILVRKTL